ncbi:MAG: MliC family protein [Candidatus Pacebacteria bacterium]|nr:MliC family protein [Candidatus Paceibacterota bacterium]
MKRSVLWTVVAVVVIVVGVALFFMFGYGSAGNPNGSAASSSTIVTYLCDNQRIIAAQFGSSSVTMALSDGRSFQMPQTMSGSGIRYEQGSGTAQDVTFVNEGDNAYLMENGSTTYDNCVVNATPTGTNGSSSSFTDQGKTFSFGYPTQFSVSGGGVGYTQNWMQNSTSSGLLLAQLSIPGTFQPNSNFGDAKLTVGTSPDPAAVANCLAQTNGNRATSSIVTINGAQFTKIVYGDAAAGNRYDITSYRTVRNDQCYAVEYTIHYGNIQNYTPGAVTEFNESAVQSVLEGVVQSFKFL